MINKNHFISYTLALTSCLVFTACSKKNSDSSSTTSSNNYKILDVTGAIGGVSSSSLSMMATGVLYSTGSVQGGSNAYYAFQNGQQFFTQGQQGDIMACIVRALANHNVISSDGSANYFNMDDSSRMKINATVDSSTRVITSYNIYSCSSTSGSFNQDVYIGSAISNGAASMTFKAHQTGIDVGMSITGNVANGVWSSKTVNQYISVPSFIAKSTISQEASSLVAQSAFKFDDGSGNVTQVQQNSTSTLYGDSDATYAMGDGSAKTRVVYNGTEQASGSTPVSWDSSGADNSTSSHLGEVSSASFIAVPTSTEIGTAAAFSSGTETWDCSFGSSNAASLSSVSPTVQTEIQACIPQQ